MSRYNLFVVLFVLFGCANKYIIVPGNSPSETETREIMVETIGAWNDVMSTNSDTSQHVIVEDSRCWNWILNTSKVFYPDTQNEFYERTGSCAVEYQDQCPSDDAGMIYGYAIVNGVIVIAPIRQHDGGPGGREIWECTLQHETIHLLQYCTRFDGSSDIHGAPYWTQIMIDHFGCAII
jgi:hypothetical protein